MVFEWAVVDHPKDIGVIMVHNLFAFAIEYILKILRDFCKHHGPHLQGQRAEEINNQQQENENEGDNEEQFNGRFDIDENNNNNI